MDQSISYIENIINQLNEAKIFVNKLRSFIPIFESIKKLILCNSEKKNLRQKLLNFSKFLEKFNPQCCDDDFSKDSTFESISNEIDQNVKDIISLIKKLYHQVFNIPSIDSLEDIIKFEHFKKSKNSQSEIETSEIAKYYDNHKDGFNQKLEKLKNELLTPEKIQCIRNEANSNEKVISSVIQEKETIKQIWTILSALKGPYIEELFGASIRDSGVEILTKKRGEPLEAVLSKKSPFSLTVVAFKIAQVMSYIHSKKVIFRDLNLANILIDHFNPEKAVDVNVMITNFEKSIMQTNDTFIFIPNISPKSSFCAPELTHNTCYNEKVDVFAFGEILYRLVTFSKPYKGKGHNEIQQLIIDENLPSISTTENIQKLIYKCWNKSSRERFSFDQIIDMMSNTSNPIILPSDEKIRDEIIDFYSKNSIKNKNVLEVSNSMDSIINELDNNSNFKCLSSSIRLTLIEYKSKIRNTQCSCSYQKLNNKINELRKITSIFKDIDKIKELNNPHNTKNFQTTTNDITNIINRIRFYINEVVGENQQIIEKYENDVVNLSLDYHNLMIVLSSFQGINCSYLRDLIHKHTNMKSKYQKFDRLLAQYESKRVEKSDFYYEENTISGESRSAVHKGIQISTGRLVAIKKINDCIDNMKSMIYLRREIGYLIQFQSDSSQNEKYFPEFIGFCVDGQESIWLISEYIENSLYSINKSLNAYQRTKIAFRIAESIEYLHSQCILHRDLKTMNILVKDEMPFLIDFGCTRFDTNSSDKSKEIGTINYMAPEVYDSSNYGRSVDIYSFAMILWELYSLQQPFSEYEIFYIDAEAMMKDNITNIEKKIKELLQNKENGETIVSSVLEYIKNVYSEILPKILSKIKEFIKTVKEKQIKYSRIRSNIEFFFKKNIYPLFNSYNKERIKSEIGDLDENILEKVNECIQISQTLEDKFKGIMKNNNSIKIMNFTKHGTHLHFESPISIKLRELIEKSWAISPQKRPNITSIINQMIFDQISYLPEDSKDTEMRELIIAFYEKEMRKRYGIFLFFLLFLALIYCISIRNNNRTK